MLMLQVNVIQACSHIPAVLACFGMLWGNMLRIQEILVDALMECNGNAAVINFSGALGKHAAFENGMLRPHTFPQSR